MRPAVRKTGLMRIMGKNRLKMAVDKYFFDRIDRINRMAAGFAGL